MQDTPLVPERERPSENRQPDEREREPDQPREAPGGESDAAEDASDDPVLIDQRFTRHRAGDTVVLYDRLEQTTWVQADYDPADLV